MAGKKKKAETIFLVCEESGDYNYSLKRKTGGEKLKLKKYCPRAPQAYRARRKRRSDGPRPGGAAMAKRWRIHPHDADRIAALERRAMVPAVVAQLLVCRGIRDPAQARRFLDPKLSALRDPELLPGCSLAAARIQAALAPGRRIVVYGDYDVDGMTGTAMLWPCLKLLGADVGYYVPHRLEEGYGLNAGGDPHGWRRRRPQLIVTVDCGIGSLARSGGWPGSWAST